MQQTQTVTGCGSVAVGATPDVFEKPRLLVTAKLFPLEISPVSENTRLTS